MWANIMKELGATDERAMQLRFHTQTGGATLTAQQPKNNIARVTLQAMAAVLGGTQSLHTNGYDEALSLPTEEAARIALRTQQIIGYESGVSSVVDPFGGSYFMEALTDEVEAKAYELIQKIDQMGGAVSAIEKGFIQDEIAQSSYKYQKDIESKEKIIVGVNEFVTQGEVSEPVFRIDESIRDIQSAKLKKLKEERHQVDVAQALLEVQSAARDDRNMMPFVIDAVEKKATLGEISNSLREIYGEYNG
jgi:methylmalonyl-CoA mutase N-terminal domain/subunit